MREQRRILPADVARCEGIITVTGPEHECLICRRRLDPPQGEHQVHMGPPVDFWSMEDGCVYRIADDGEDA